MTKNRRPKQRQPFFRKDRQLWYVQLDGRQINLGQDRVVAWARYHELMAQRCKKQPVLPTQAIGVVQILERFMDYVQRTKAPRTYDHYRDLLKSFRLSLPKQSLTVEELVPANVTDWLAKFPKWAPSTQHGAIHVVKQAIRWGCKEWKLGQSPLAEVEAPTPSRREVIVTPEQWPELLAACTDEEFHDLLSFLWESGARPQEARRAEKRHFDQLHRRLIFPKEESKGKRSSRVIYLTDTALEIVKRLCAKWPDGQIFRMPNGKPWTRNAIRCRFRRQRLHRRVKLKINGLCCYAIRHSYATNALQAGVDPITLAVLMGHKDATMIANVYQHLATNPGFLLAAAQKARTGIGQVA